MSTATGQILAAAQFTTPITQIQGSPEGNLIAAVSTPGSTVTLTSSQDLSVVSTLVTAAGPVDVEFSPDGARLYVTCSAERTIQVFDLAAGAALSQATTVASTPTDAVILSDGSRLAVALPETTSLLVLDATTLIEEGRAGVAPGSSRVATVAFAHSTKPVLVVTSEAADTITLVDQGTLDVLKTLSARDPGEATGDLSPFALIAKGGTHVAAHDVDPLSPRFGETRAATFTTAGLAMFAVNQGTGTCVALSADRLKLVLTQ
ncbi:MAG: YncE family protein, partial [Planctomycetota bacterium]